MVAAATAGEAGACGREARRARRARCLASRQGAGAEHHRLCPGSARGVRVRGRQGPRARGKRECACVVSLGWPHSLVASEKKRAAPKHPMAGPPARRPAHPTWLTTVTVGVLAFWAAFAVGSAVLGRGGGAKSAAAALAGARSTTGDPAARLQLNGRERAGEGCACVGVWSLDACSFGQRRARGRLYRARRAAKEASLVQGWHAAGPARAALDPFTPPALPSPLAPPLQPRPRHPSATPAPTQSALRERERDSTHRASEAVLFCHLLLSLTFFFSLFSVQLLGRRPGRRPRPPHPDRRRLLRRVRGARRGHGGDRCLRRPALQCVGVVRPGGAWVRAVRGAVLAETPPRRGGGPAPARGGRAIHRRRDHPPRPFWGHHLRRARLRRGLPHRHHRRRAGRPLVVPGPLLLVEKGESGVRGGQDIRQPRT